MLTLETIEITIENKVAYAHLNRPRKANALNATLWFEIEELANWVNDTPEIRVLVLSGRGKHFCAGIDFSLIQQLFVQASKKKDGHKQEFLYQEIRKLQNAFTALEQCRKPVIANIIGSCIGGGIDLITACDLRYAHQEALFCVKEIDLAIVADVGTIQRLPALVGEGTARELAFTARTFGAPEAQQMGLLNGTYPTVELLSDAVQRIAEQIANKSPLVVRGTKKIFNYSRDHSIEEGLNYVATWNASMLLSTDTQEAFQAMIENRPPNYRD